MLGAGIRVVLGALLVVVMAGSAAAFALGVNFSPHASCPPSSTGYGAACPAKKYNLHHVNVRGFGQIRNCQRHVSLTFTNRNQVPSQVRLVLRIKTKSGQVRTITRTFTLGVGKKFTLSNGVAGSSILSAQLHLTVKDANGDVTTITDSTKGRPVACVKAASAVRSPSFTG